LLKENDDLNSHKRGILIMEITNPAITDGVNLFVNIVIFLAAFGAAISAVDFLKEGRKSQD